ncbi:site-specific integrase [Bacillaceae bacterium IKA-2]|nr:site-specific integrase [Bacillaceae bacterium IKA-2]
MKQEKKTKKWTYIVENGLDSDGKRKRKIKKGFKTKTEAKKAMAMAIANQQKDDVDDVNEIEPLTLGEYLDYWLESYAHSNTSPNTYKGYERIIRVHLKPGLGNIKLSDLHVRDIQKYYGGKLRGKNGSERKSKVDGALSAQTVKHHHRLLSKALSDAVDWEYIEKNPAKKAKPPRSEKTKITTYTIEGLHLLFESAKTSEIYFPIIFTAAYTGGRLGELRALCWSDVDFSNKKIYIRKTACDVKGEGVVIKHSTKSGKERAVMIGKRLLEFLENHKRKSDDRKTILGSSFNPHDLVFHNTKGNYLDVRDLTRAYKKAIKTADLPDCRFHDLRHTHATILLQANVHPKIVSERLGHSKISITLDTYSHVLPSLQDGAAAVFDDAFQ